MDPPSTKMCVGTYSKPALNLLKAHLWLIQQALGGLKGCISKNIKNIMCC